MVSGAVSKGRSSSRKIHFLLRKLGFWCAGLGVGARLGESSGCLSRNKLSENGFASLPQLLPPTVVSASVHALAELNLSHEPLLAAAHTACEHVRTLESSGVFNCSGAGPACGENEASQTNVGRGLSTPSNERRLPPENVNNSWSDEEKDGALDCSYMSCWFRDDPIFIAPSWFSAPLRLTLPVGSRPDYWRNELLYRAGDIECHPGPKRALPLRGRDVLVQDVPSATAQRCESQISMGSKSSSITVSMNWVISSNLLCIRNPRTGTSRYSYLQLETLCASGPIL